MNIVIRYQNWSFCSSIVNQTLPKMYVGENYLAKKSVDSPESRLALFPEPCKKILFYFSKNKIWVPQFSTRWEINFNILSNAQYGLKKYNVGFWLKSLVLLPKLFWPAVIEKNFLRSLEQFIRTVRGQYIFWDRMLFKIVTGVFSDIIHCVFTKFK